MDYNTSRKQLFLPEYGRNIQRMVNYVKTVEDRDERNRLAMAIIQIMGNMNPHLRDVADFKHKLWDHLAIISNFELDVDSPYPTPTREELYEKPKKVGYSNPYEIRFKHYGRVLQSMIQRAVEYPEGEEKEYLIEVIGNQMKKSYLNWNRDTVGDEQIIEDLKALSGNKLVIPENLKLKENRELIIKTPSTNPRRPQKKQQQRKGRN